MTLAQRLLVAFGLLALVATGLVGMGVRSAWRTMEEQHFDTQLTRAKKSVVDELSREAAEMRNLLGPVCDHDAFVDQTLIDLERHELDSGRRLAITQLVPEEMKALQLDELLLLTGSGEILGAGNDPAAAGKTDRGLLAELSRGGPNLSVRLGASPPKEVNATGPKGSPPKANKGTSGPSALVTRCIKRRGPQAVGLIGARHLGPILDRIGAAYDVRLVVSESETPGPPSDEETRDFLAPIPELEGLRLAASISRRPLEQHLAALDDRILIASAVSVAVAIAGAMLLARSLARPIEELAQQARGVVRGDPRPVRARGGRELEALARAFNQAIEDLASLRKRLAVTERIAARREIARQVAHEIKNPLAPIRAAVETLRRLRARSDPAFDEYFDEATRTVLDEVFRITKIVSEFTEFARFPPPRPGPVDVEEVARSVVALHAAGGASVSLKTLPAPTIQADRDQLVQVLTNLIQNGLEAADAGRGPPRVDVRVESAGPDRVAIAVADNGPGVSADMLPRLFEPYATSKPNGTGLGLAIVHRIVQEHGGEITYEKQALTRRATHEPRNSPGDGEGDSGSRETALAPLGGAVFRIELPVAGPGTLPPPPSEPEPGHPA